MHKLDQEKFKARKWTSNILIGLLILVAGAIACLRVIVANQQVGNSEKLHVLDEKITSIRAENQVLSEQLASKESLLNLEAKVMALGFIKVSHFAYLPKDSEVAWSSETSQL